ncbi:MAG: thiamine diphosphokinase [bacterium]
MIVFQFTDKFDAITCLDGMLPDAEFFQDFLKIPIFSADGAVIKLIKMKIGYEKVIGDMDTLQKNGFYDSIQLNKIVYLPDQETNDFEKTLDYVHKQKYRNILITGIHGGELEHSLNNWSVLMKYMFKLNICIYDKGRYAIPVSQSFTLPTFPGETIGLIPQPKAVLSTRGFKWELDKEILELGVREGARNIAMGYEVEVDIIEGSLLLFLDARIPYALNI